jgi:phosphatidate cytidylyltransferase
MKQRVITALIVTPFAIAMFLFVPTLPFAMIIGALCLVALWEWSRLSGMRSRPLRAVLVALCGALMVWLWLSRGSMFWLSTIGVGVAWWFVAVAWLKNYSFAASPKPENTAIKLVAGILAVIPAWTALMDLHAHQTGVHSWALYSLVLIWGADTFAYLAGKRFGRHKLAPNISPGKTIEGVYGALVGSAIVAALGGYWLGVRDVSLIGLIVVALLSVLFSVVGDLFESVIKRQANVKDSGAMFPGHGGVFDRLDGAFAGIPIFVFGKFLLGL